MAQLLLSMTAHAQPKALGGTLSFTGLALCYEHQLPNKDSFVSLELKAEGCEFTTRRSSYPGVSASALWNSVIKTWKSSEGNAISLFAGPGICLGYCQDYNISYGYLVGLKGRFGVECSFERNIILSAALSPIIGAHLTPDGVNWTLKYYRNGLQYGLIPEVGVKYRF